MISALVFLAVIGAVADDGEAKRLFEAGGQAYEQGRYTLAIDAFEAAHRITPRAVTAFAGAQAYRLQYFADNDPRKLERAVELYRAYLELAPDGNRREHAAQHLSVLVPILEGLKRDGLLGGAKAKAAAPARTQVIVSARAPGATVRIDEGPAEEVPASFVVAPGKHRIDVAAPQFVPQTLQTVAVEGTPVALNVTLEPQPGALAVRASAPARLLVDGKPAATLPLAQPVPIAVGHHTVAVAGRGYRLYERDLEVGRGQRVDLDVRLDRTAQRWFSYALIGAGAAVAVASAACWGLAAERQGEASPYQDKLDRFEPLSVDERSRFNQLRAERDDFVVAGAATAIAAAAAGAVGVVLWLVDTPEGSTPMVVPTATPGGAGLTAIGRF